MTSSFVLSLRTLMGRAVFLRGILVLLVQPRAIGWPLCERPVRRLSATRWDFICENVGSSCQTSLEAPGAFQARAAELEHRPPLVPPDPIMFNRAPVARDLLYYVSAMVLEFRVLDAA